MINCRNTTARWGWLALVALLMSTGAPVTHAAAGQEPLAMAGCFNAGGVAGLRLRWGGDGDERRRGLSGRAPRVRRGGPNIQGFARSTDGA